MGFTISVMFRLGVVLSFGIGVLYGQSCVPAQILPVAAVKGTLAGSTCALSDGTPYAAYRLVLPVRGQSKFTLDPNPGSLNLLVRDSAGTLVASGNPVNQPLEAGTYVLVVNLPAFPGAGAALPDTSYTLQTAFTPEASQLCSGFPLLGLNQTVTGSLGSSGCTLPDGTQYEAYSLSTFGAGSLTITVSSDAFQPLLMVRGDDNSALASDGSSVTVPLAGGSLYQIVVATADKAGAFLLTTSFTPSSTDTCLPQAALQDGTPDKNAITTTSCSVVMDDMGDQWFYNYYNLHLSAAGQVDLAVGSDDFSPTLYLLDANGNTLALDFGGGAPGANWPGSEIQTSLPAGDYVVQVFSNYASGGNYQLSYKFNRGAAQPCAISSLNPGTPASGSLSRTSCRTAFGLSDIYTVTLPAAGMLSLDMDAALFTGQVALRDSKDNVLVFNQDLEQLGTTHVSATLPGATYTVVAGASSGAGPYQLTAGFTAAAIAPCTFVQPLSLNGGYVQNLSPASCVGTNGQPMDLYQFTLPVDSTIAAVMTSSQFDPYLKLLDSAGNVLRSDDNSYGYSDPLIVQFLPAGTYQLMARAASTTVGGLYQVNLLASAGARPPFCGSKETLAAGGTITGPLTYTACQFTDATFADVYTMTLPADGTIDLRLNSTDFDAYLVLQDAKGNLLAQDDDSGGGTNSRIQQKLSAGAYYVYAKPFANYYSLGSYSISLTVQ